jgi:hypothetical protein
MIPCPLPHHRFPVCIQPSCSLYPLRGKEDPEIPEICNCLKLQQVTWISGISGIAILGVSR